MGLVLMTCLIMNQKPLNFIFDDFQIDLFSGQVQLKYEIEGIDSFCETIELGKPSEKLNQTQIQALTNVIKSLWITAGMSYFKAYCPPQIIIKNHTINASEAAFFNKLYLYGLGEFAVRNELDLRGKIKFPSAKTEIKSIPSLQLKHRIAIPIGGGKDSLVTLEQLKASGNNLVLVRVNRHQPIEDCIELAGLPDLFFARKLDPKLFKLNNDPNVYNGHVPITAIISFILSAGSIVHGYNSIAFSNEKSANEGNMKLGDLDINHQYSKSLEFEQDFQKHLEEQCFTGLNYYSHLREYSELEIAQMFTHQDKYDSIFTSCNKNFKLIKSDQSTPRWCGDCPKCRFVFLALATAMKKNRLLKIFGKNLLSDPSQLIGYQELTGNIGHKPWECVGEIEECQTAFINLKNNPEWEKDLIVAKIQT